MEEKSLSQILREQMKRDGKRYFACDNISDYLDDETREFMVQEVTSRFQEEIGRAHV